MKSQILKISILLLMFLALLFAEELFSQNPSYTLTLTNDQQVDNKNYEFDIYLLRTGPNSFEYANNSQYFININPAVINGGTLTFTIVSGTSELNAAQQILGSKVSFDNVNNRLRIASHSPSGDGTGTIIANSGFGTRLGRFRVTNTVTFAAAQANLSWYNGPTGFFTKMFAYVGSSNVEITVAANHIVNLNNPPLPVEITEFGSVVKKNTIILSWITLSEINNSGFEVERSLNPPEGGRFKWVKIGFVHGSGTIAEPRSYSFEDKNLNTGIYSYRLRQIDYNGNSEYFKLQNEVTVGKPGEFNVSQNYPNPSNPKSKIDYEIPITGKVTIKIYDVTGSEVVTLVDEIREAGYYSAEFDGSNLASGVYFYRITSGEFVNVKKLILVK
jgi:hypothetical protein